MQQESGDLPFFEMTYLTEADANDWMSGTLEVCVCLWTYSLQMTVLNILTHKRPNPTMN